MEGERQEKGKWRGKEREKNSVIKLVTKFGAVVPV